GGVGIEGGAEDPAGDLPDRAVTAGEGGDRAGGAAYGVVGTGDRHGPAGEAEAREVVDVVADVEHALGRDALFLAPLLEGEVLAVDAVQHGNPELAGAGGDDRVLFRGQDQDPQAGPAQGGDAQPVAAVHGDELLSLGVDQHPVVGLGAVEVEDDRVEVGGRRQGAVGGPPARPAEPRVREVRVEERGEGAGPGEVVRVVDLQDAGRVGGHGVGAGEEAVPVGAETGRVHGVGRAGLQQVLRAVLAAGADGLVVVDAVTAAGVRAARGIPSVACVASVASVVSVAPEEAVERGDGDGRVGAVLDHRGGDRVDVLAAQERAGALHEQHHVHRGAVRGLVGVQGVQDGRLGGGGVAGEGGGPWDDLRAGLPGHVGDVPVVGGDDDVRDVPGGPAGAHRAGHQRDAADGGEVLRGHTLGAA